MILHWKRRGLDGTWMWSEKQTGMKWGPFERNSFLAPMVISYLLSPAQIRNSELKVFDWKSRLLLGCTAQIDQIIHPDSGIVGRKEIQVLSDSEEISIWGCILLVFEKVSSFLSERYDASLREFKIPLIMYASRNDAPGGGRCHESRLKRVKMHSPLHFLFPFISDKKKSERGISHHGARKLVLTAVLTSSYRVAANWVIFLRTFCKTISRVLSRRWGYRSVGQISCKGPSFPRIVLRDQIILTTQVDDLAKGTLKGMNMPSGPTVFLTDFKSFTVGQSLFYCCFL